MPELDLDQAQTGNLEGTGTNFQVDSVLTDGATGPKETTYINENWEQQHGYYRKIPELNSAIDAKATWTVGKGVITDEDTKFILDSMIGWGKDTFNTIMENMIRVMIIGGDSYAQIIRDDGELINLKTLNPSSIRIHANNKGIITHYEQISRTGNKVVKKFAVGEMFHLARNRVADEIHGVSIVEKLEVNILMRNEAMDDMKKLMHRHVKPMVKFILDTDKVDKINTFIATADRATNLGENLYLPKGTVEHEIIAIPTNATLNPLPWLNYLNQEFYRATGGTDIVLGGAGEFTEASAKIKYLAFQQNVEEDQLFIEEQIGIQLGLLVEFEFPVSLENELLSDKKKDGDQSTQPNETTAGSGQ